VVSVHGSETKKSQEIMRERVDRIRLVLEHHKVDAYFNGHLHLLEHRTLNGVTYIVSGGGGKVKSYALNEKYANVPGWCADGSDVKGGFATLSVDLAKGEVDVRYLDSHGQELFSPNLSHPRRNSEDRPFQPLSLDETKLPRALRIGSEEVGLSQRNTDTIRPALASTTLSNVKSSLLNVTRSFVRCFGRVWKQVVRT